MSTPSPAGSAWERSTTRRFFNWLFSVRILRRILFLFVTFVTLIALFYTFENWRGKRAWRAYSKELKAQGVVLDFAAILPPEIPADSNFATTPFFADIFKGKPSPTNIRDRWPKAFDDAQQRFQTIEKSSGRKNSERRPTDLVGWQIAFRKLSDVPTDELEKHIESIDPAIRAKAAHEVLTALKVYGPVLDELRAASSRPNSRYLVYYDLENPWGILLPHLAIIKRTHQMLQLKGAAELAAGNVDGAFHDLQLQLRLVDSLESEPFAISHLVRITGFQIALHTLWEGMGRWSAAQLAQTQARLASVNFVADLYKTFASERSTAVVFVDLLQKQRQRGKLLQALLPETPLGDRLSVGMFPMGWFELERRNYVEMFQSYYLQPIEVSNRVLNARLAKANERAIDKQLGRTSRVFIEHRILSRALLPALNRIQDKTAQGQVAAHQAVIACALERHRLAKGHYPDDLGALVPGFLPRLPIDPVNGGPMRYKPGKLYSIGWDEKDDGGIPGKSLFGSEGDWVWTLAEAR